MKIYYIEGQTGEYSDAQSWNVKGFQDKEAAERLCMSLNQWCKEKGMAWSKKAVSSYLKEKPPEDPYFQCDYTGTRYVVIELEVETGA